MKEENNACAKTQYKCALCGKAYDKVHERMKCEMQCIKTKEEEEKKAAIAKKQAEKEKRQREGISEEYDCLEQELRELISKFTEDYGTFTYNGKYKGLDMLNMDFFPSKLWHHFWF